MPETSDLSEAKRALLEKYLRGEIAQARTTTNPPTKENPLPTAGSEGDPVPVVSIHSTGSRRPLFYAHAHADGGAFYCFTLADRLGPDQPFYILEPYRFDAAPMPCNFEAFATEYIKSMRAIQPEGPYLLGGFCGGGLIIFEMAHQLRKLGQEIDLLLLIEPVDGPGPASYRMVLRGLAGGLIRWLSKVIPLSSEQQLNWFLRIRHYYLLLRYPEYRKVQPRWLFPAQATLHKDWIGIFVWLISGYKPVKYPGKLTYLWAKEEFIGRREWRGKQAEAVEREVHLIPGDHWSCRNDYLHDMAASFSACVGEAQAAKSS